MGPRLDSKYYDYYRLIKIDHLTKFEDIEIGQTYHIPPIILYGRRDVIVTKKDSNSITCKVKEGNDMWVTRTLYRGELSLRFIVKKQEFNEN